MASSIQGTAQCHRSGKLCPRCSIPYSGVLGLGTWWCTPTGNVHCLPRTLSFRFSSEICGTIIVQCIPILRPFLSHITTTIPSSLKRSRQSTSGKSTRDRASFRDSIRLKTMTGSDHSQYDQVPEPGPNVAFQKGMARSTTESSQRDGGNNVDFSQSTFFSPPSPRYETHGTVYNQGRCLVDAVSAFIAVTNKVFR